MTWQECCRQAAGELEEAGIENANADAWFLMEAVCAVTRNYYYLHAQDEMPHAQEECYKEYIRKRCGRIPLQYLTGEQEFMGLTFRVTPDVLIPRQDTESLVEEALKYAGDGQRILDICTGSGCIAVSLKFFVPGAEIVASDISKEALLIAEENARLNHQQIRFINSDLFENITGEFDMIVSNPPYIPSAVIDTLMPEVRDHEPVLALDGAGDGLYFYRMITEKSISCLKKNGMLLYEIGYDQGEAVSGLMKEYGYEDVRIVKDLAGLDRVVIGRRKEHV